MISDIDSQEITRFILIRHAESRDNASSRFSGRRDSGLSKCGTRQAEDLREFLAGEPLAAVISSSARRAVQTAEIITAGRPGLPVELKDELRERSMGEWEGLTFSEAYERDPRQMKKWLEDPIECPPPGGESLRDVAVRTLVLVKRLVRDCSGQTIALISHGGVMRVMLAQMLEAPLEFSLHLTVNNASVTRVTFCDGFGVLESLNDTSHLS